jgi:putative phage-type endonuclease
MNTQQIDLIEIGAALTETFDSKAAWLAGRRHGIGGSDAAAVVGVSPWKSTAELWAEKLELLEAGVDETEAMEWGLLLEPVIRAKYTRLTGVPVMEFPAWTLHRSREHPFMTATLDGLLYDATKGLGVFQAKTASAFKAEEWAEEPPIAYQVQVQHEMQVIAASWGVLAVLIGGQKFRYFEVARNERFTTRLVEQEAAFFDRLEHREPPEILGPGALDLLKRLYPKTTPGLVVALPGEAVEWDLQRQDAISQEKKWKLVKEDAEARIKGALKDAELGVLPNGVSYSWKLAARKGYIVDPTTYRDFRRKGNAP